MGTTTEQNKDNQATEYKKYDVNILFCTDAHKSIVYMSEISINIPIYKNTVWGLKCWEYNPHLKGLNKSLSKEIEQYRNRLHSLDWEK